MTTGVECVECSLNGETIFELISKLFLIISDFYTLKPTHKRLLLVVLFVIATGPTLLGSHATSSATGNATRAPTTQRTGGGKVDQFFRVQTDHEGGNVDELLADANVALADEDARVVDALGQAQLDNDRLQTTLQEILNFQPQDIVQLGLGLVQDADADEAADEGVPFEQALRVGRLQRQQLTGSLADAGQRIVDAVNFSLVAETVLAGQLHFVVQAGLDVRATGDLVNLGELGRSAGHFLLLLLSVCLERCRGVWWER